MWAPEKVRRGELSTIKVHGEDNVADGLTSTSSEARWKCTWRGVDLWDARGDISFALILEMFESVIKLNGFVAEVHLLCSPLFRSDGIFMNFGGSLGFELKSKFKMWFTAYLSFCLNRPRSQRNPVRGGLFGIGRPIGS